jgi:hypothetical protein
MSNCSSTLERQQCSDHGYFCDAIQACICEKDYFSSRGQGSNLQCDVNLFGVILSDYLIAATCVITSSIIVRRFVIPYFIENSCCRTISIRKAKSLFPFVFLIAILCQLCQCIDNLVGKTVDSFDFSPSYFFNPCFIFFSQFGFILYFLINLEYLKTCNGYISQSLIIETKKFHAMIQRLASIGSLIPPASFLSSLIALIGIQVSTYRVWFIQLYLFANGILAFLSCLIITFSVRFVLNHLIEHVDNFDQRSPEIEAVCTVLRRNLYMCAFCTGTIMIFKNANNC